MRVRKIVPGLAAWLLSVALCIHAQAGDDGSIEGTVKDPSGAIIAGAEVRARNLRTSATVNSISNDSGLFQFPVLVVGAYELTATHDGFAPLVLQNIQVTVGARVNLSLMLSLPTHEESFRVTAETPLIETTRSQVSSTVDEHMINNLPVNGRNFNDFTLLLPGVSRDARTGVVSFAGQRSMNSLLVDGADTNQTHFGLPMGGGGNSRSPYQFSLETVQEFQVNSNAYSAEFGRAGAGVVNVVTKSGNNEWHGTGLWYYRDKSMNANDSVNNLNGKPKSPYHFNQFGVTVGGPIVKN